MVAEPSQNPPLQSEPTGWRLGCWYIVFLGCFLGSSFFFYLATLRPLWNVTWAHFWRETPCVIESSKVDIDTDYDGHTTYRVDIRYRYIYAGQRYHSTRYEFDGLVGELSPQFVVDEHPAGSETVCFVNPASPEEAVINRRMNAGPIFGMVALVFMFLTGGPFFLMLREARRKKKLMEPSGSHEL